MTCLPISFAVAQRRWNKFRPGRVADGQQAVVSRLRTSCFRVLQSWYRTEIAGLAFKQWELRDGWPRW
jgi:hypothetical protein